MSTMECPHCHETVATTNVFCPLCSKRILLSDRPKTSTRYSPAQEQGSLSSSSTSSSYSKHSGQRWEYLVVKYEAYNDGDTRLKKVNEEDPEHRYTN
jgi:DNA-directed RNA polymerase subunit RPC12/RpoP